MDMAKKEIFVDTHLDLVFSPLNVNYGITVEGSVADEQQLDQSTGQYTPDYTKSYLVLKPWMRVMDPDGVLPDGEVAGTNVHLYGRDTAEAEVTNGTEHQVAADGRISIRKNVGAGKTRTYRVTAEYQDPRTGDLIRMEAVHPVSCESVLERPRLVLNQPALVEWDPTNTDPARIVLEADLRIGRNSVPAANRELIWEKKDMSDSAFARIYRPTDANYDILDYDVEISSDVTRLTLDRSLMGDMVDIRCRAKYDPYGNPSAVTLDERSPSATARFTRHVPVPTVRALSPQKFDPTQKSFVPEARFYVGLREITNPMDFWSLNWYMSKGVANGSISRTLVATGVKPTIPTSSITQAYGATLQTGVTEKNPLSAITTDTGAVIVDGNDNVILV